MSNVETIICDKCKNRVSKLGSSRTYTLALSNKGMRNTNRGLDKITLCSSCDNSRHTSITKYIAND